MATLRVRHRDPPCQLAPSTVICGGLLSSAERAVCKIALNPSSRCGPAGLDFWDGTAFARFGAYDDADGSGDRGGCGGLHDVGRARVPRRQRPCHGPAPNNPGRRPGRRHAPHADRLRPGLRGRAPARRVGNRRRPSRSRRRPERVRALGAGLLAPRAEHSSSRGPHPGAERLARLHRQRRERARPRRVDVRPRPRRLLAGDARDRDRDGWRPDPRWPARPRSSPQRGGDRTSRGELRRPRLRVWTDRLSLHVRGGRDDGGAGPRAAPPLSGLHRAGPSRGRSASDRLGAPVRGRGERRSARLRGRRRSLRGSRHGHRSPRQPAEPGSHRAHGRSRHVPRAPTGRHPAPGSASDASRLARRDVGPRSPRRQARHRPRRSSARPLRDGSTPARLSEAQAMYVHRPDARIFYQVTGRGARDLFLLPQCQVVTYSRMWKHQVPYLSRYFRVISMDPRGNGRSDRPASGYDLDSRYDDLCAVLEEIGRPPLALVAFSCAAPLAFRYAVAHPERLSHLILLSGQYAESVPHPFEERVARVIRDDFDNWRQRLFTRIFPEPHSLKGIEDCVAWAGETTPEILIESLRAIDGVNLYDLLGQVSIPTLALHGTHDKIVPYSHAQKMVAAIPGARLVTFDRGGHGLFGREAVKVNHLIRDFVLGREVAGATIPSTTERRVVPPAPLPEARRPARGSQRRVLWLSSPIGLGHIQRDLAIARRLRERHPDVVVEFLAADPADRVVRHWGERLHPATRLLQNESQHFESWSADHELHAFNALWDMDEILTANFMTLADVVERERYDLWIGDEGWDLDYFLHENPDLKRAPYAFLTDFIGMLPMREDRTSTEFIRCWEKSAENIDHLRFHPDVRDLSLLVGDDEDVLDREFGPDLPNMRQWAREHFRFSGYTFHFDPRALADRAALRAELGYRADERVILVGGPRLAEMEPAWGPRVEVRAFVPDLFKHHAAVDLAIVQGGLTTTMELAALRTPFLYFPLRHHFEQQLHVARRLDRLGAGVRLDYDSTSPEALGAAMLEHLGKPVHSAEVPLDGTDRAARLIAELL